MPKREVTQALQYARNPLRIDRQDSIVLFPIGKVDDCPLLAITLIWTSEDCIKAVARLEVTVKDPLDSLRLKISLPTLTMSELNVFGTDPALFIQ
jgi:hypothetical protein